MLLFFVKVRAIKRNAIFVILIQSHYNNLSLVFFLQDVPVRYIIDHGGKQKIEGYIVIYFLGESSLFPSRPNIQIAMVWNALKNFYHLILMFGSLPCPQLDD